MRKVIVIINTHFVHSAIARVVFFLITYFILISSVKSQSITIDSWHGTKFEKPERQQFSVSSIFSDEFGQQGDKQVVKQSKENFLIP